MHNIPADPITRVRGIFADQFAAPKLTTDELRRQARDEDADIEERKYGHLGGDAPAPRPPG